MPLVRSNDAPDSADPVRCASQPSFKPSSCFFPAQPGFLGRGERAFEASHGERTAHQARIRRWISPHHLGSPPSSRHRSLTRAVFPVHHSQVRRHIRSGAVHRCTASRCAPWKPRRRVRGQPVRRRGLIRRRYARDAAVHRLPVRPHSDPPFLPTRKCASPSIQPARSPASIDHARDREPTEPNPPRPRPNRNMGNGWVQRTRRSTVERVIERVHTDVDEMVPVAPGGAGGHLGGSGVGGSRPRPPRRPRIQRLAQRRARQASARQIRGHGAPVAGADSRGAVRVRRARAIVSPAGSARPPRAR